MPSTCHCGDAWFPVRPLTGPRLRSSRAVACGGLLPNTGDVPAMGGTDMATHAAPTQAPRPERRPELDAVRMLVVIGLVFFHSALVFAAGDDFYVKNAETTEAIMIIAGFGVVWAVPLLFLISGLGAWHSLRRRGAWGFAGERLLRLGVPLVFAPSR